MWFYDCNICEMFVHIKLQQGHSNYNIMGIVYIAKSNI